MSELAAFQQDFGRALLSSDAQLGTERSQAIALALTIHRNTSTKGLVDALAANYSTVAQLVGEEWFKACAIEFVRAHPARSPVLATYGAEFAPYLAEFPPAAELPYLSDVAQIDRMWVEAHTARDAIPLSSAELARLPESALAAQRMQLHPAARIAWVRHSAATIWIHHRSPASDTPLEVADADEGILLTRAAGQVEYRLLDRAAFEFLASLSNGSGLGEAAEAALRSNADADVGRLLAETLIAGTFECPLEMPP
jgi:hypothetical protein